MEGKSRFTPKQINKALRLLRELPVKDGRKSIQEALHHLEQGMKEAIQKGYSRGEIRRTIAAAEVTISSTTLKGFLAEDQKEVGQKQNEKTVKGSRKSGQYIKGGAAGKTKTDAQRQGEEMAGIGRSDGMGGQGELESSASNSVSNEPYVRSEHDGEAASNSENSSRKQHGGLAGEDQQTGRKQARDMAGKVSPGSLIIKPDTPREEL